MNSSVVATRPLGPCTDSRSVSPKGRSLAARLHLLAKSSHPLATRSWMLSPNASVHLTSIDTGVPQSCCPDAMIACIRKPSTVTGVRPEVVVFACRVDGMSTHVF
jgi:hypothetical protein